MEEVSLAKIREARERIQRIVTPTPIMPSVYLQSQTGLKTLLKLENLNISGSFKIRGASNALLDANPEELKRGVTAASAGNHAQGVAYVARHVKAKATIFMPERTPLVKVEATRSMGAKVILTGEGYDDAFTAASVFHKEHGGRFVHAYADPAVINGQGSIGLELLEQVPDLGLVIVPIGGGGLISGLACAIKALKPDVHILGVQSTAYPAMKASIDEGHLVNTQPAPTIADGIAVKFPGQINFDLVRRYVDEIVLVDEDAIASAIMDLMERGHLLAEGAGAVSVAALLHFHQSLRPIVDNRSVVCIISGGNIDVNLLTRITTRGLIYSGRLMRMRARIKDKPGSLAELLNIIGQTGANLLEVEHNRLFVASHYSEVEVMLDLETTNRAHQKRIAEALSKAGIPMEVLGVGG